MGGGAGFLRNTHPTTVLPSPFASFPSLLPQPWDIPLTLYLQVLKLCCLGETFIAKKIVLPFNSFLCFLIERYSVWRMMINFWVVVTMLVIVFAMGIGVGAENPKDHNKDEHEALCSVLSLAVTLFESGQAGNKLQKALGWALFGSETGESNTASLLAAPPPEYHNPGNRQYSCGTCTHSDQNDYPGKSIPHDLVCMCTVGQGGYPFLEGYEGTPTLCGKSAADLGCAQDAGKGCHKRNVHWWTESNSHNEQARKHVNATWNSVVKPCLGKLPSITLEEARDTLLKKLKVNEDRSSPTWVGGHHYCSGGIADVCVSYDSWCLDHPQKYPQWWKELYEALAATDLTPANQNTNTASLFKSNTDADKEEELGIHGDSHNGTNHDPSGTHRRHKRKDHAVSHLFKKEDGIYLTKPLSCGLWPLFAVVALLF
ncbi:Variant surface glycoprotein [Trypanosoma congolense IL3000]|uniref:Variant surface glycoprotein n=1 Tax=Trypanosoma congolense (strain IL3000) TaxID=1068625 RepID=F9W477_TRYCI|nr:Variant surface glycoprotein [Trypanosoma congolense IL3000]